MHFVLLTCPVSSIDNAKCLIYCNRNHIANFLQENTLYCENNIINNKILIMLTTIDFRGLVRKFQPAMRHFTCASDRSML